MGEWKEKKHIGHARRVVVMQEYTRFY